MPIKKKSRSLGWPKAAPVDEHAARELQLYTDNDQRLYNRTRAIEPTLAKFVCKQRFNVDDAARAYEPILAEAARHYSKEFSTGKDGLTMFSAATRRAVAKEYAIDFKSRVNGYLKHGQQDLSQTVMDQLRKCDARPLAGAKRRRARR